MAEVERWTIFVCTACGQATGRHKDCDAKREAVEVVPAEEYDRVCADLAELRDIAFGADG